MNLQPYLKLMSEQHASDMYFTTGAPVSVRIEGKMRPVGKSMLSPGMTRKLAYDLLSPAQIKDFENNLEFNMGMSYTDLGRFRINMYMQRGEVSMVIRYFPLSASTVSVPASMAGVAATIGVWGSMMSISL